MTHRFTSKFRHFLYNTIINMKIKMRFQKFVQKLSILAKKNKLNLAKHLKLLFHEKAALLSFK